MVTACGSSSSDDSSDSISAATTPGAATTDGFVIVQRYPNTSLTPGIVRLPVSLANPADGRLLETGPATISGRVLDAEGNEIGPIAADLHGIEMLQPYWPLTVTLGSPGIYYLAIDGADGDPTPFQLFEPSEVAMATVGATLTGFDTPTTDDARGVDPLCTRSEGTCPFHEVTLTEALQSGKQVVYLVGTPAHCQTGTCAPGLEYLVEQAPAYADRAVFIHAEVYSDNAATTIAPAVTAARLDYEPVIFVTDASGTVIERIDIIWDDQDLAALLERALS